MKRLELPEGQWADLDDPHKVSERRRRPYTIAMGAVQGANGNGPAANVLGMGAVFDALIVALVTAWSFDLPITADGVQDLPGATYDALRNACMEYTTDLLPTFGPSPDPKAPIDESTASPTT